MTTARTVNPLPVGHELDARVHTEVMGRVWDESRCRVCGWPLIMRDSTGGIQHHCWPDNCSMRPLPKTRADAIPAYSTDIAAAWQVIEKLSQPENHWQVRLTEYNADEWFCDIAKFLNSLGPPPNHIGEGFTAPEAICRAALLLAKESTAP